MRSAAGEAQAAEAKSRSSRSCRTNRPPSLHPPGPRGGPIRSNSSHAAECDGPGCSGIDSPGVTAHRTARGCLPNVVIGIVGGVIGGWLVTTAGMGSTQGFIGALVVAVFGALIIRLVLNALERRA